MGAQEETGNREKPAFLVSGAEHGFLNAAELNVFLVQYVIIQHKPF